MAENPTPDEIPVPGRPPTLPAPSPEFPQIPRPQEPVTPYPVHPEPAPTPEPPTKRGDSPSA